MLNIHKLDTDEGLTSYKDLLKNLNSTNPYYSIDYINFSSGGLLNLICFSFNPRKDEIILMPGYIKPIIIDNIESGYFDFISPYGYSGPICTSGVDNLDFKFFWSALDKWYKENNIVTEFIRFNLFGNQIEYSGNSFPTMLNVKGQIIDEDAQWNSFDYKVRKNYKKAIRENLKSEIYFKNIKQDQILEFYDIYKTTMDRNGAKDSFFYSFSEFKKYIIQNEENCVICTVYHNEIPISSELILVSQDTIYSFLGGTLSNYFDKRPNDFLKVQVINWARNNGKKYFVLGGGYGFEDGIFKYKKSFFPLDVVNYYTGRKILNKKVYDQLVTKAFNFKSSEGMDKLYIEDNNFFPLYRKKD
ncbi:GNAT family N-acetyltransferase [Flavobacterium sp.]|uniref:GNAT family N-acetyltransferase n=1 Tax=Flavobacterium sp. TaxID=239 RepID=UPI00333E8802